MIGAAGTCSTRLRVSAPDTPPPKLTGTVKTRHQTRSVTRTHRASARGGLVMMGGPCVAARRADAKDPSDADKRRGDESPTRLGDVSLSASSPACDARRWGSSAPSSGRGLLEAGGAAAASALAALAAAGGVGSTSAGASSSSVESPSKLPSPHASERRGDRVNRGALLMAAVAGKARGREVRGPRDPGWGGAALPPVCKISPQGGAHPVMILA